MPYKKRYRHLTKVDREEIGILRGKGYAQANIALALGLDQSSVSRELSRNKKGSGIYDPRAAQGKARERRRNSKYQGMKIAEDPALRRYVADKLAQDWSPEQIAGRLKRADCDLPYASPEGIYKFLYSAQSQGLWRYLRRAGYRKRRRARSPKTRRELIPHRRFIEERPALADSRERCGDFEVDRVESGRDGRGGLLVLRDRKSGYFQARKVRTKEPEENARALVAALSSTVHVHTLTYDNDLAFREHEAVNKALDSESFFCHPYHSWEKGGIENENGLLRQYVPKGTDISRYTAGDIAKYVARLNTRPRKRLDYKTPLEVFSESGMLKRSLKQKNTVAGGYALEG